MPVSYLPPEIWLEIIKSLCRHCNGKYFVHASRDKDITTIASLCRVSKIQNRMATPFLYHEPTSRQPYLLLRTLAVCPELAAHVRELHYYFWAYSWPHKESIDEYPPSLVEDLGRRLAYAQTHLTADMGDWNPVEGTVDTHVRDAALIGLLPNLARISLESNYRTVCFGFEPGSLPNLTSVSIQHGDTETFLIPRYLKPLADAAPNITALHLDGFGAEERSIVTAASWRFLLRAFPRLKIMAYGGGDPAEYIDEGGTAYDIQHAVTLHCPYLKKLCVDYSLAEIVGDLTETERAFDHGLASLKELECLITASKSIGSPVIENDAENGCVSGICIDALPTSLRSLRILDWLDYKPTDLGEALIDLAAKVPARLPALEKVSIVRGESSYELDDQLRRAWDDTGVKLTLDVYKVFGVVGSAGDRSKWEWQWP